MKSAKWKRRQRAIRMAWAFIRRERMRAYVSGYDAKTNTVLLTAIQDLSSIDCTVGFARPD